MAYWWLDACAEPDMAAAEALRARWLQHGPADMPDGIRAATLQLAALQRTPHPRLAHVQFGWFAGDHGIGTEATPEAHTGQRLAALARGDHGQRARLDALGAGIDIVDLGVRDDPGELPGVRREVIAPSTFDWRVHPAMGTEQARHAVTIGATSIELAAAAGAQLFVGATLGDADTLSARALACRLLGITPRELDGGATDASRQRNDAWIAEALARHTGAVDALACLRRLGGFEMAALAGACVAGAQRGLPVLVDGLVGAVVAMVAIGLNPDCRPWLFVAHDSDAPGFARVLAALHLQPVSAAVSAEDDAGASLVARWRVACAAHGMAS